jgi:hypothetical protein
MRRRALFAIVPLLLAGCIFQRFAPTQILQDQVHSLNDETRWGRVDLASERVAPSYRRTFLESRVAWGRDVRIADTELNQLILATDMMSATSTIEVTWYDQRTMEVSSTVLRQHWIKRDDAFLLDRESVLAGDEALLDLEEEEDETEDTEAEPET